MSRFGFVIAIAVLAAGLRFGWQTVSQPDRDAFPVRVDYWAEIGHSLAKGHGFSAPGDPASERESSAQPGSSAQPDASAQPGSVVRAGGYEPTAIRVPVFPAYLAGVYRLTGGSDQAALWGQLLLDGLAAGLITLLGMNLLGFRGGVAGGVLFALYLPEWRMMEQIWSEPLYTVVLLGTLGALLRAGRTGATGALLVAGICGGLLAMTRPVGAPLALGLFAVSALHGGNRLRGVALLLAGFAVPILPWIIRNLIVFDAFIPLDTTGGFNLYLGTLGQQGYVPYSELDPDLVARVRGATGHETDGIFRRAALRGITDDPGAHVMRSARKLIIYLFGVRDPAVDTWPPLHRLAVNGALLTLAGMGYVGLRRRMAAAADLLLGTVVFSALVHSQIMATPRFFFPVLPAVLILAVSGVAGLAGRLRPPATGSG